MATRGPAPASAPLEAATESILGTAATFWPDGELPDPVIAPPPGVYTIIENGTQLTETLRAAWPTQKMLRFASGDATIHQDGVADLVDGTRTLVDCQGQTWSAIDDAVFLAQYNTFLGFYNCTIISPVSPVPIASEVVMWHVYNLFDCDDPNPELRGFFAMFNNGPAYFPNDTLASNGGTTALFNTTLGCATADGRLALSRRGEAPPATAQGSDGGGSVSTLTVALSAAGAGAVLLALTLAGALFWRRHAKRRPVSDTSPTVSADAYRAGSEVGSLPPSAGRVSNTSGGTSSRTRSTFVFNTSYTEPSTPKVYPYVASGGPG